ncbi:group XIIB secretory phospholipase A2-like protein isoform X2 [Archocentrus centrarchus]|uniref:group XIIB secretory phospholipase A2-like protein isoform X2 n=1 Tax=Archocentrus centrarchus TaxID=63155 RepID=UPI0011EA123A|nr:group XIIB secretory phospholipase A2-like protein isoform X2 [Archocentrus centrarchus]
MTPHFCLDCCHFNTMPLRTVVLLLLCLSTGMCATLGYYQTDAKEEGDPAAEAASVDVAKEGVAAALVGDSSSVEGNTGNSVFGDKLLLEMGLKDNQAGNKLEKAVQVVAEGATGKEPGPDSGGPPGDTPGMKAFAKEAKSQEQPSGEEVNEIRPVQTNKSQKRPLEEEDTSWSLNSIRNSFQTVHGYFDSLVELVGGRNGVCEYRCRRYGELPQPRPGYQPSDPNGCSTSLVGFQLDLGIPAMTKCCNQLDMCYENCGTSKYDCDSRFRSCLYGICSDLKKSLGFVSKVQACESMADALYNTVWTLGCRPYMNSQRAACVCEGEERDEL